MLPYSTTSDVQEPAEPSLSSFGISPGTVSAVDTDPGTHGAWITPCELGDHPGGTAVTVTMRLPFTQVSWLPSPFFLGGEVVTGSATLSSERP